MMTKTHGYVDVAEIERRKVVRPWGTWLSIVFGAETCRDSFVGIWSMPEGVKQPYNGWKWHDEEQIEYIVSGSIRIGIGTEKGEVIDTFIANAGEFFFVGKEVRHRAESLGPGPCIGLKFSPKAYPAGKDQPHLYDHPDPFPKSVMTTHE